MKAPFDKDTAQYVYILVRGDLSPPHQTVQAIHAGMQAANRFGLLGHERLVLLEIENEDHLSYWAQQLEHQCIEHEIFFEPDHNHRHTALATRPMPRTSLFKKLPLWGKFDKTEA